MKRFPSALLGFLLLVPPCVLAQKPAPDLEIAQAFEGEWLSSYGLMTLTRNGLKLSGPYGNGQGRVDGAVKQGRFEFQYVEPGPVTGRGWFALAADRKSFSGKWHTDATPAVRHDWQGRRAEAAQDTKFFHGLYSSQWGPLRLLRDGDKVTGIYEYRGRPGRIEGTVKQRTLTFTWKEADQQGEGRFELDAKGQAFTGSWHAKGQQDGQPWNGQRARAQPGLKWLVVLEAHWESGLAQPEYSFGEMLDAWFKRYPQVQTRHRRFQDLADFQRAARQIAFLAEPVVLSISTHGKQGVITAGKDQIQAEDMAEALNWAGNLQLIHFSSCEMMVGDVPQRLQQGLVGRRVPLSGYAASVDWSASGVLEMLYFDCVLGRNMRPAEAAKLVQQELKFAGDQGTRGSPLRGTHFRFKD